VIVNYTNLKRQSRIWKSFTGVTVQEFAELELKGEPLWLEQEFNRLNRPDRQRAMGGGQQKTLPFREQ